MTLRERERGRKKTRKRERDRKREVDCLGAINLGVCAETIC